MKSVSRLFAETFVKEHNDLINQNLKLKLNEYKLFLMLISYVKETDEPFQTYYIWVKDFVSANSSKSKAYYNIAAMAIEKLGREVITIPTERGYKQIPLIYKAEYEYNRGFYQIQFHPEIMPYIKEFKIGNFTRYLLKYIMQFKSHYSIIIYRLLMQFKDTGYRIIDVDKFKELCDIKDKYNKTHHLKSRVLNKAQEEINNNTDIKFTYRFLGSKRTKRKIEFIIKENKKENMKMLEDRKKQFNNPTIDNLVNYGISRNQAIEIYESYPETYILDNITAIKEQWEEGKLKDIKNLAAYTISAIKNDYRFKKSKYELELEEKEKEKKLRQEQLEKAKRKKEQNLKKIDKLYEEFNELIKKECMKIWDTYDNDRKYKIKKHIAEDLFMNTVMKKESMESKISLYMKNCSIVKSGDERFIEFCKTKGYHIRRDSFKQWEIIKRENMDNEQAI